VIEEATVGDTGGYVVRDSNGQAIVYLYSRPTETDATLAEDVGSRLSPGAARCLRIGLVPTGAASRDAVPETPMPTAST
jgi:hypothetical protein